MRLWFNHWFSTVYHLINLIKEDNPNKFYIIGSNANYLSVYKSACDEWYQEPSNLSPKEYVDFCIDFCIKHQIDIFIPRKHLVEISKNLNKFNNISVKVLVDNNYKIISMLDDKYATYEFFKKNDIRCIPETRIAKSLDEFLEYYNELKQYCSRVCYKLTEDEGARSFRVIDNKIESINGLLEKPGAKITLTAAKKVLEQYDFSIPILLMPYLSGVEVSVDCISTIQGNLIIPRFKTNKRYSEIIFDEEIIKLCDQIMNLLNFEMPINIQFKMENGKYYLLEINPRMSGGLQLSCKAANINLPSIAINKLLEIEKKWKKPTFSSQKVVHIETPICFD